MLSESWWHLTCSSALIFPVTGGYEDSLRTALVFLARLCTSQLNLLNLSELLQPVLFLAHEVGSSALALLWGHGLCSGLLYGSSQCGAECKEADTSWSRTKAEGGQSQITQLYLKLFFESDTCQAWSQSKGHLLAMFRVSRIHQDSAAELERSWITTSKMILSSLFSSFLFLATRWWPIIFLFLQAGTLNKDNLCYVNYLYLKTQFRKETKVNTWYFSLISRYQN